MKRSATREDLGLTPAEFRQLRQLDTPEKVQSFLSDRIHQNGEIHGETLLSVRQVLRHRHAHCIEGAMVAACALWIHGEAPLLLDLEAERDLDHVVALFRRHGCWGAISKTGGAVLRWRDPVYRSLRELALSYVHEYFNNGGEKTLRRYSRPFDLRRVDPKLWVTRDEDCWEIVELLTNTRHYPLMDRRMVGSLRRRDRIEMRVNDAKHGPGRKGSRRTTRPPAA